MAGLAARAEIERIAELLKADPERLAYLERLSAADLTALREALTARLYDEHRKVFDRLVAAGRILPAGVAAAISERAFGPLLTARMASSSDPRLARQVASRLPAPFLAEVAVELDPRRAAAVLAGLPAGLIATVAGELADRGEYVTMGRFVGELSPATLDATLPRLGDEDLLRIGFVIDDGASLGDVLSRLPADRLAGLVRTAVQQGLWDELMGLLERVEPEALVELAALLEPAEQERFAASLANVTAAQRRELAVAAAEAGKLEELGALGEVLRGVR